MKRRSDVAESTGFENRGVGFIQVSTYFMGVRAIGALLCFARKDETLYFSVCKVDAYDRLR